MATFTLGPPEPYRGSQAAPSGGFTLGAPEPYQPGGQPSAPAQPPTQAAFQVQQASYTPPRLRGQDPVQPPSTGPSTLDVVRADISAPSRREMYLRGQEPSLPQTLVSGAIANAPTELGILAGGARGAAMGAARGAQFGPWGAVLGGLGGGTLGALAEEGFAAGTKFGESFANPFAGDPGTITRAYNDALMGVAGGVFFPMLQNVGGAIARRFRREPPRDAVTRTPIPEGGAERALERQALSEEFNIPYTYGELTGARDLIEREKTMIGLPGSGDPMERFMNDRIMRTQNEVGRIANEISAQSPQQSFSAMAGAAGDVLQGMRQQRRAITQPMYTEALASAPPMRAQPYIDALKVQMQNQSDDVRNVYKKAIRNIERDATDGRIPAEALHNIQSSIASKAETTKNANLKRVRQEVARGIKDTLDTNIPGYGEASQHYRRLSKRIDFVNDSTKLGNAARSNPAEAAANVAGWFRGEGVFPEDVRTVQRVLKARLPSREYNNVMQGMRSAYLKQILERVKPTQGDSPLNIAGRVQQALGGAPEAAGGLRDRQMIEALFTPDQVAKLGRLATALDDTSKILSYGAATQMRQLAARMCETDVEAAIAEAGNVAADLAVGGQQGALTGFIRNATNRWNRITGKERREMEANTLYANILGQGTEATMRHFDRLDRALQRALERPSDASMSELSRAWGTVLGGAASNVSEQPRPAEPSMAMGFAGG